MKMAIVGAHGTGKSTLLEGLDGEGFVKVSEVARDIIKEMGKSPQEMSHQEKVQFQLAIYAKQKAIEKVNKNIITDRGYDNLAYAYYTCKSLYGILLQDSIKNGKVYDKVIYTPIEFPLVTDGIRYEGDAFQVQIQDKIIEIGKILGYEPIEVTGSIEERVKQVNKTLYPQ